ncbi:MAG: carboxy-S-adenosyl-L-methionine synthase CmoA [Xanthomonadales bacterium]|jgi:tRNA (cmo5U34)-methyltransferase|nr:carboxy-S-adenosyl-L-methionine synthase CmoA [Xanthomonadales bacterium]
MTGKDRLYENTITEPGDFVFDERVVSVFPDMINRSIPGYGTIVPMIGMLARRYARPDTRLYDLGCSLGAVTLAMRNAVTVKGARIVAVDNSAEMVAGLRNTLQEHPDPALPPVELRQEDIRDTPVIQASVVVLNFTLQFVDPAHRNTLLERIANGLETGGILVLSEKICFQDSAEQALQTEWHHDFKRAQGYSDLEIARKRDALENVMVPESLEQHRKRLSSAGFRSVHPWFQGFNFMSLVAFR